MKTYWFGQGHGQIGDRGTRYQFRTESGLWKMQRQGYDSRGGWYVSAWRSVAEVELPDSLRGDRR